ncbi:serine hydrolase domain-containing protein [Longispora albida]|uniref:serine hydrolase domain-containing protein n=1 Tax=Longispora albida TaxID=203523 RepID=UPI0003806C9E|nr:serine hydrolase domain-containing protein [Longispora albida]
MIELLPGTSRALLHRVATAQREGRAPSVVAGVVREGALVWANGWGDVPGPVTETRYRIGSLTKTFVAVLVMRLRNEGLLGLDDPCSKHLPGTTDASIAELLAHTAGLPAESPGPWWERTPGRTGLDQVVSEPLHPAGRVFHYSNPGYTLLGALVEKLRGEPWGEALRKEILEPLGMTRTSLLPAAPHAQGWAVHPHADVLLPEAVQDVGIMAPAGQLWSTVGDLGAFGAFLLRGDDRVLPLGTIAEMREPAAPGEIYGLGFQLARVGGRLLIGHTGSMPGFLCTLWTSPGEDLAAVILANCTSGVLVGGTAADLIRIVADAEPAIPAPWRPAPATDPALVALTGTWYWGTSPFTVHLHANSTLDLVPAYGNGRATQFRRQPDGTWLGLNGYYHGETLRVAADHFDLGTFVFTRQPYDPAAPIPGGVDPAGWRGVQKAADGA